MAFSANRTISGTWGEVWLDGELVSECYGLTAKAKFNRETVAQCGVMGNDGKITSIDFSGTMRLNKVFSRMSIKIGEKIQGGQDVRFTIISKLADPDAYGAERVVLKNVSFDDLTLADWEAKKNSAVECPFVFSDYEFLDQIEVR
ncbi:phage tail tube protein [Merdimmobilis hominis]|uniref:phage tail tube protein n=1 Tax=Merdimmobilis hominis TaxID=2897707 RepID=UPI0035141D87